MRAHLQLGTTSDKPQFRLALGAGSKTGALVPTGVRRYLGLEWVGNMSLC